MCFVEGTRWGHDWFHGNKNVIDTMKTANGHQLSKHHICVLPSKIYSYFGKQLFNQKADVRVLLCQTACRWDQMSIFTSGMGAEMPWGMCMAKLLIVSFVSSSPFSWLCTGGHEALGVVKPEEVTILKISFEEELPDEQRQIHFQSYTGMKLTFLW